MDELAARVTRFALEGPARPQAADGADGDRDRARRRDGRAARTSSPTRSTRRSTRSSPTSARARTPSITGKSAFDLSRRERRRRAPPFDESLLAGGARARRASRAAEGSVDGERAADRQRRQGDRLRRRAEPRLLRSRTATRRSTRSTLVEGDWPGRTRSSSTSATADKEDFEVGQTIGVQAEGPVERLRISGIVKFGSGLDDRRRHARRLRPADGAAALRQAGQARRDRGRRQGRRRPTEQLDRGDPGRSCRPTRRSQSRHEQATEDADGHERVHHVPAGASCSRSAGSRSSSAAS